MVGVIEVGLTPAGREKTKMPASLGLPGSLRDKATSNQRLECSESLRATQCSAISIPQRLHAVPQRIQLQRDLPAWYTPLESNECYRRNGPCTLNVFDDKSNNSTGASSPGNSSGPNGNTNSRLFVA